MPLQTVRSAMVGVVSTLVAAEGAPVVREQAVIFLEVMKMQIPVEAPADGRIHSLLVDAGDVVDEGQPLFVLET